MAKSYKYGRSRKPISLKDAQLRLTDAIKEMEKVILNGDYDPKEIHTKIQACYAMSNVISRYTKLVELNELTSRIEKLEQELER